MSKQSYYQKLKYENEELKRKLNATDTPSKQKDNAPSFLFTNTATNEELYLYLRENPSASRFIFKKYTANQSFLKELVDPENPIYLDGVANNLKEIYQIKEEIENVEKLRSEKGKLNNEISKLRDEIKQVEDEYVGIYGNLEKIRKEDEEYSRQRTNIRTDKGLEMLEQNLKEVTTFQNTFLDKWNKYFSGNPTSIGMTMDRNEINLMDKLNRDLKEMMGKIHTEDFLSTENLDQYHQGLLDKMKTEKDNALKEMNAFMAHNPKKMLNKILNNIDVSMRKIDGAPDDVAGGFYLNKLTGGMVVGNLDESMKYINYLLDQVENSERRMKK